MAFGFVLFRGPLSSAIIFTLRVLKRCMLFAWFLEGLLSLTADVLAHSASHNVKLWVQLKFWLWCFSVDEFCIMFVCCMWWHFLHRHNPLYTNTYIYFISIAVVLGSYVRPLPRRLQTHTVLFITNFMHSINYEVEAVFPMMTSWNPDASRSLVSSFYCYYVPRSLSTYLPV